MFSAEEAQRMSEGIDKDIIKKQIEYIEQRVFEACQQKAFHCVVYGDYGIAVRNKLRDLGFYIKFGRKSGECFMEIDWMPEEELEW